MGFSNFKSSFTSPYQHCSLYLCHRDYTDFLEDLEEDPQYRTNVNIYCDQTKVVTIAGAADEEEDLPQVGLEEMLDDLIIDGAAASKCVEVME